MLFIIILNMKTDLEVGDYIKHKFRKRAKGVIIEITPSGEVIVMKHGYNDMNFASVYFLENLEIDTKFLIKERNKKIDKLCQEKYNLK